MDDRSDDWAEPLLACAKGHLPPNVAILQLAMRASTSSEIEAELRRACGAAQGHAAQCLEAAFAMWRANPQAFALVKRVLGGIDHGDLAGRAARPADWAKTFDQLAAELPEAAVALYALGSPDLLRASTEEVVERLGAWGLLTPLTRLLEIGCGIGRFVAALAPRVQHVTGLDLSSGMIARAREVCSGFRNVRLDVSDGLDLRVIGDGEVDVVLAADVFPYLVPSGLAEIHIREAARVLAPRGHLVILNYSYRGDDRLDADELTAFASRAELEVVRKGTREFALWDAAAYVLRKG